MKKRAVFVVPVLAVLVLLSFLQAVKAEGPMQMAYGWSKKPSEQEAVKEALATVEKGLEGKKPMLVVVFTTGEMQDQKKIFDALKSALTPEVRIWGLNSDISGVVVPDGIRPGITLVGFYSPGMVVGVGKASFNWQDQGSYRQTGKNVMTEALRDAGKGSKDPPKLVLFAGPDMVTETDILLGMRDVVGKVYVWGGNAGNLSFSPESPIGNGWCYHSRGVDKGCVTVAAIWTKTKIGTAYGYGYTEKEHKGKVTKVDAQRRVVCEIDNRPAADVYNEWIDGQITDLLAAGGGLVPMGIIAKYPLKKPGAGSDYILIMPAIINPDKSMAMTLEVVDVGTELTLTEISREEEVSNKPAAIATIARIKGDISKEDIAGALFSYCCAQFYMSKQCGYDLAGTFPALSKALNNAPYAGFLAGGEIGCNSDLETKMLSASTVMLIFGKY